MKIAVVSGKGGVGKTTIACGLSSIIASRGKDITLIDLDPQANATWGIGGQLNVPGSVELLTGLDYQFQSIETNFSVIAAGHPLMGHEVQRLNPEALADALENLSGDFVFDNPPVIEHLERLSIVAADVALIIVDAHPYSIQGANRVLKELEHRANRNRTGAKRWGIVMSKIDARRSMDKDLPLSLSKAFPNVPLFTIRQDATLAQSSTIRKPIMQHEEKCRGVEDMNLIVDWIYG